MLNIRPILFVIGFLLTGLAVAMLVPAFADFVTLDDNWKAFVSSAFITGFCGLSLVICNYSTEEQNLGLKQAFILTTASWVALVAFAAIPLKLSDLGLSVTDSFFESMSALTTTGATVMVGLDDMPVGVLLWRSILQWLGGIGIIVMAMAVLPMLKIGGMQLFRTESSDNADKVLPRVTQLCGAITSIYATLTIFCGISLWLAGMTPFDALNHAMTAISTSGFSTHDASISFFDNPVLEAVLILFMILGGIPFILFIQFLRGKPQVLWQDSQVHWFLALLVLGIGIITAWLYCGLDYPLAKAFREASFNVVAVATTTGYSSADYNSWGSFPILLIFMLAVVGGCTGSTTGGIKIFRYQVLYETAKAQINQLIQPHGIFRPTYNRRPISPTATASVMSFVILFAFCFSVLAVLLSFTGMDFISSMSGAGAMMANLGPALGDVIGPTGNYSSLSDSAKWILSFGMLIGRLEIFTVLILFSPYFWRH